MFGTPLFFLYALRGPVGASLRSSRLLLSVCAGAVVVGALVSLVAQTAMMAGDPSAAFDLDMLTSVVRESAFGLAIGVRVSAATAALAAAMAMRSGRGLWFVLSGLGAVVLASFAWSGHGAAEDGAVGHLHAAADVLHLLAAGVWLGALAAMSMMLVPARRGADIAATKVLHDALVAFSGVGAGVVATIIASGLINSWFLVGAGIWQLCRSIYGQLLVVKLLLFAGMLGLAALNRYRLTPSLANSLAAGNSPQVLITLRRSILIETAAGAAILVVVGLLGTLAPASAQ